MIQETIQEVHHACSDLQNNGRSGTRVEGARVCRELRVSEKCLCDVGTGKTFQPSELTIVEHHRFEGASDPDDLSIVYGIEANDGTRGALSDAYGAYANPDLSAFLKKVPMRENL
jgi:hypothetical protein